MTYPIPRRKITGSMVNTFWSSIRMRPPVGSMSRLIMRSVVVLPQPEGPISMHSSPSGMVRLRALTATSRDPYRFDTASRVIMGPHPIDRQPSTRLPPVPALSGAWQLTSANVGFRAVLSLELRDRQLAPDRLRSRAAHRADADRRWDRTAHLPPPRSGGMAVPFGPAARVRDRQRPLHHSVARPLRNPRPDHRLCGLVYDG